MAYAVWTWEPSGWELQRVLHSFGEVVDLYTKLDEAGYFGTYIHNESIPEGVVPTYPGES